MPEPIGVIGTGYVGLVTAAGFAELGTDVYCIDIDAEKIAGLERGEIPIYEPGLEELVAKNRERMHFSTDIADALQHARLLFVAVGTPPTYSGDADLSAVFAVVDAMPASDEHALVMKSTVPCGTGANIQRRFRETGKDGFRYVSCPEFLKEGSAVADFLDPDRVVVGDEGDWAGPGRRRPLRAAGRAAGAHRHPLGGDDQARLQRVPGHQDLLHQRDRQRLRRDRRRRGRGGQGHGPRRAHRPEVPAGRHRLRRLAASPRTCRRSSSWPATPATRSSC